VRRFGVVLAVVMTALGRPGAAAAQVIVPPRGEGTITVSFQNYRHTGHFDKDGHPTANTSTDSQILIGQLDFGITDTFGLVVALPLIASRYTGPPVYLVPPGIETHAGPLDNGQYHAALQDMRIELRRMFETGPVVVAPFAAFTFPTHDYETQGESVPGRHRKELQVGVGATTFAVPRTELHGRYAYATLERANGFDHKRSNIDVDGDVAVTSRVSVQGLIGLQLGHHPPSTLALKQLGLWDVHDRLINASSLHVGGGASFALTRTVDIYALGLKTIWGHHGAHIARTFAIGISKTFGDSFGGFGSN
jgi:opacity protein-like surface antigen